MKSLFQFLQDIRQNPKRRRSTIMLLLVSLIILVALANAFIPVGDKTGRQVADVYASALISEARAGKVDMIELAPGHLVADYTDGHKVEADGYIPDAVLLELLNKNVNVKYNLSSAGSWMTNIYYLVSIGSILLIAFVVIKRPNLSIGGNFKIVRKGSIKTRFKDVAGQENAKHDLQEIAHFLQHPERYAKVGARLPKGALMVGSPGVGKTLLARALAGEADVTFIHASGSTFRETFMGQGGSKVRKMFAAARRHAPAIVFIDEIESLGHARSNGPDGGGGARSEEEATLNALLVELDGFEVSKDIVLIGATNRPDMIDPALLRPGRFDRRIQLDTPDQLGRIGILNVHFGKTKTSPDINVPAIARKLTGMSGADLANLVNEAAIRAARRHDDVITPADIDHAFLDIAVGRERPNGLMSQDDKETVSIHEAGHAIVSAVLEGAKKPLHATIIPRGQALGFVLSSHDEVDKKLARVSGLEADIVVYLSGRAAEYLKLGHRNMSTGAADDFKQATNIALKMAGEWSMAAETSTETNGPNLYPIQGMSEKTRQAFEKRAQGILQDAWEKAIKILKEYRFAHETLTERLIDQETVTGEEIMEIVAQQDTWREAS